MRSRLAYEICWPLRLVSSSAHLELLVLTPLLVTTDSTLTHPHNDGHLLDPVHYDYRRPTRKFYDIRHTQSESPLLYFITSSSLCAPLFRLTEH